MVNTMSKVLREDEACPIRKKAYKFLLRDGTPLRVVTNEGDQSVLMPEFHESPWFGLPGTWATFEKVKERYRWLGMYKDVHHFVSTCESYQMYSAI